MTSPRPEYLRPAGPAEELLLLPEVIMTPDGPRRGQGEVIKDRKFLAVDRAEV